MAQAILTGRLRHRYDTRMTTTTVEKKPADRSTKMRKIGGYGAAVAVTPYLFIKILWTFGLFIPTTRMGDLNWRAINLTTALLAMVGILLALAFSRPWGERLPAW